jgi:hypothetical protein
LWLKRFPSPSTIWLFKELKCSEEKENEPAIQERSSNITGGGKFNVNETAHPAIKKSEETDTGMIF